jgi:hypothetical protein
MAKPYVAIESHDYNPSVSRKKAVEYGLALDRGHERNRRTENMARRAARSIETMCDEARQGLCDRVGAAEFGDHPPTEDHCALQ